ncbi:hypothetical protein [Thiothrix nivea]|uniref:Lipoprotein n=1 Tax=Thiothrix nivea (strain ATCC 35100 / DSM 5205 / JP2) TaxID=870187 RepID=A0A656HMI4_THINJ|nr:hypothetical protein [Thiothrix nivea]EIJ36736.1 hypothetical protein Thini_4249 [Thiothrix nivea DSM 5205]
MKQKYQGVGGITWVLAMGLSLAGCSGISQQVSDMVTSINPFQQQTEAAVPATPAPAAQGAPVTPANSLRVQAKPPAPTAKTNEMEVNLGNNKQCTTFCALPMRKPPAAAQ